MIKSILCSCLLLVGSFSYSQNVSATVAVFDMLNELEAELPENWQVWDWSISTNKEIGNIPAISVVLNYREIGTKNSAVGATIFIIEKVDQQKMTAYLEQESERFGAQKEIEAEKSSIFILMAKKDEVTFDKWKKQLKILDKFLLDFFEDKKSTF